MNLGIENVRAVRDLWARKDISKCENDVTVSLKPHSSEFLRYIDFGINSIDGGAKCLIL